MSFSICNLLVHLAGDLKNLWFTEQLNYFLKYISNSKQHLIGEIRCLEIISVE